jgi:F-type H+-transporting ATPase subunit delta
VQDHRVARRYANALFQAAQAGNIIPVVEEDLARLVNQVSSNSDFRHFLKAPYASREEKAAILDRVFSSFSSPVTMQLLKIMVEKRREGEITGVYEEYVVLRRAFEQVAHAVVISAEPLDATQQKLVISKLESMLRKRIEPKFETDAALIGGIRVKYENFVLDGSVRGALGRMREKLTHDVLKQA